jgi:hypothetical protein
LWAAPFGLINVMRRAIPLTSQQHRDIKANNGFPRWDYMPGGPDSPLEHKQSDWAYLDDGRLVALDYPRDGCRVHRMVSPLALLTAR